MSEVDFSVELNNASTMCLTKSLYEHLLMNIKEELTCGHIVLRSQIVSLPIRGPDGSVLVLPGLTLPAAEHTKVAPVGLHDRDTILMEK